MYSEQKLLIFDGEITEKKLNDFPLEIILLPLSKECDSKYLKFIWMVISAQIAQSAAIVAVYIHYMTIRVFMNNLKL